MLTKEELYNIKGGSSAFSISGLNAIARLINTILSLGRAIGSSISRLKNKNYCY